MKKVLYALGALLLALGFGILGRDGRAAKRAQNHSDKLILDSTKASQEKAKKLGEKAERLQQDAQLAAEAGVAALNKVGAKDESMDSLLDTWRSDRV